VGQGLVSRQVCVQTQQSACMYMLTCSCSGESSCGEMTRWASVHGHISRQVKASRQASTCVHTDITVYAHTCAHTLVQ